MKDVHCEGTEQVSELCSDMEEILEISDQEFKTTMTDMKNILKKKKRQYVKQMDTVNRDRNSKNE